MKQPLLKTAAGLALLASPLLIQIPFTLLTINFGYPDILREVPAQVLTQFAAGGDALVWTWYAYGLAVLPLLLAIALLPGVVESPRPKLLEAATRIGIASALVQMIGLWRWVFLVPQLAGSYGRAGSDAERQTIVAIFDAQHRLFGVLLGEHLGQTLLALWTLGVVASVPARGWHKAVGIASAALFLIGGGESLSTVFPALAFLGPLPMFAFLGWSLWCSLLGWRLLRAEALRREPGPLAEAAMERAGL